MMGFRVGSNYRSRIIIPNKADQKIAEVLLIPEALQVFSFDPQLSLHLHQRL